MQKIKNQSKKIEFFYWNWSFPADNFMMNRLIWKRLFFIAALLVLIAVGSLIIFISQLPDTPQEEFTYHTGYPWPSDATLVEIKKDYHHGFKTEGTTLIHARMTPDQIQQWLTARPPFGKEWQAGADHFLFLNKKESLKKPLRYCTQGSMGSGQSLTVDSTTGDAWYYSWRW